MGIFIMLTMQTITIFRACFQLAMGITEVKKHYILKNVLLYLFFLEGRKTHYSVLYKEYDSSRILVGPIVWKFVSP